MSRKVCPEISLVKGFVTRDYEYLEFSRNVRCHNISLQTCDPQVCNQRSLTPEIGVWPSVRSALIRFGNFSARKAHQMIIVSLFPYIHRYINTLRPRQNGRHFEDDIFKRIFLNENVIIFFQILLNFAPKGPICNTSALDQIMAWRRSGDKPLFEPMMGNLTDAYMSRSAQWVNSFAPGRCDNNFKSIIFKLIKIHDIVVWAFAVKWFSCECHGISLRS